MSLSKYMGFVSGMNEIGNFFQLLGSAISYLRSRWNNREQEQQIEEYEEAVPQLQNDLQILNDTLPSMYNLIDRAEWKSHENFVAQLLPKLKDAVYEAEDLLDEFRWYEIKVSIEGNNSTQLSSLIEFFRSVIQGSFNKVTDIQKRLINLSSQLEKTGLREATPRFDKSVRPVTTSFPTKAKIFGREHEIEEVVRLLGVPNNSSRSLSKRKRTYNEANNEPRAAFVPVLPIVGMGGVGKTTLAQEITTFPRVKSHFDKIIWICVSDEFNAERLTKFLIKSLSGKEAVSENFDDLQRDLAHEVGKKRFLLILDDIWLDAVEEGGQSWMTFCAPLKNIHQESRLLVTTRFPEVAKMVGTKEYFGLEYIELKGLEPEAFWNLFKLCVFGSENSHIDPRLEIIGRSILPKLKGNPLAVVTIGRLLQKSLTTEHWNNILNSELWQLQQNKTDILPALRLSYMYLPFHLKRCFSFCAVYPKDYNFQKASLAEMWVAEGFVEPQGDIPLQHIGDQYFEDLVNLSFFQNLRGKYVIHDLIHDMAQLVSKDECFIVKNTSDIEKIPQHVRHLSILPRSGLNFHHFSSLCKGKHKKLRTLICRKPLLSQRLASVMDYWVSEFQRLRAISLASTTQLPDNIGNLKHLRYLEFSISYGHARVGLLKILPSSFCCLYNLQIVYARNCVFESLPTGCYKLINLQKFEAQFQTSNTMVCDALDCKNLFRFIKGRNIKKLIICNHGAISKDHATKMVVGSNNIGRTGSIFPSLTELRIEGCEQLSNVEQLLQPDCVPAIKKIVLENCPRLSLKSAKVGDLCCLEELIACDCPTIISQGVISPYLKKLTLKESRNLGGSLMSVLNLEMWSLPALLELTFSGLNSLAFITKANISLHSSSNSSTGTFSSLTVLTIQNCRNLKNIDGLLSHECLPAVKRICISYCAELQCLPGQQFGSFSSLTDLEIVDCPRLNWRSRMVLPSSLYRISLGCCGDISSWFPGCLDNLTSLRFLKIEGLENLVSIPGHLWRNNLPSLEKLEIIRCPDLVSIGGSNAISHILRLSINNCEKLEEIEQPKSVYRFWLL